MIAADLAERKSKRWALLGPAAVRIGKNTVDRLVESMGWQSHAVW
jgi:hypothetical protein